jgi:hypothetical protein
MALPGFNDPFALAPLRRDMAVLKGKVADAV